MPSLDLITGGAGFIGSHVADRLLIRGHRVRVLDALLPQVHGPYAARPSYLDPDIELQVGDVRDANSVRTVLRDVDAVRLAQWLATQCADDRFAQAAEELRLRGLPA